MDTKKIIDTSMLLAISVVLSIIESFIPIFNGIFVGIKLGLANIVVLYVLYKYGFKDAIFISILRVIIVGILRTGLFSITFFFSLSGAILSILAMAIIKKTKLSIVGVSIIGSIFHIIGQIIIAIILLNTVNIVYYLPYFLIFSCITGLIIGIISTEIINRVGGIL